MATFCSARHSKLNQLAIAAQEASATGAMPYTHTNTAYAKRPYTVYAKRQNQLHILSSACQGAGQSAVAATRLQSCCQTSNAGQQFDPGALCAARRHQEGSLA